MVATVCDDVAKSITVYWESLVGRMFGEFTLSNVWWKKFGE